MVTENIPKIMTMIKVIDGKHMTHVYYNGRLTKTVETDKSQIRDGKSYLWKPGKKGPRLKTVTNKHRETIHMG